MESNPQDSIECKFQNVVATANFGVKGIDLPQLCGRIKWSQFNNDVFAALIARLDDPKTTELIFKSANIVCTGGKSVLQTRIAIRMMTVIMQSVGIECSMRDFNVQNIVASAYTGFLLRLDDIAYRFSPHAAYNPEIFPGKVTFVTLSRN